ncbi:hypothetical protein [Moraxella oculi]|uniref:TonB C-terminal domain-containing protein n=1 Tax=Moraxella oculi TaxID=2940516 RepID=A0ABW8U3J4_9GAMM
MNQSALHQFSDGIKMKMNPLALGIVIVLVIFTHAILFFAMSTLMIRRTAPVIHNNTALQIQFIHQNSPQHTASTHVSKIKNTQTAKRSNMNKHPQTWQHMNTYHLTNSHSVMNEKTTDQVVLDEDEAASHNQADEYNALVNTPKNTIHHTDTLNDTVNKAQQKTQPSATLIHAAQSATTRIISAWEHVGDMNDQRLMVSIYIDDLGNVIDIHIGKGEQALAQTAISAIHNSGPFKELAGMTDKLTIEFQTAP